MGNAQSVFSANCPELLIFGYVHGSAKKAFEFPKDVILLIQYFYYEIPKQNNIYSIHGVSIEHNASNKHLSYQSSSGKCRQIYVAYLDSQFQFIPVLNTNTNNNMRHELLYYIRNAYPDERKNHLLTSNHQNQLILSSKKQKDKTIWELIPIHNKYETMKYKIKQYDTSQFIGLVGGNPTQNGSKWNCLVDEKDAEIYEITNIAGHHTSNGKLYSILYVNNLKYFSYQTSSGYCRQTYDISIESRFDFLPIETNKYRVDDIYNKDKYYFIRNAYPDDRLDQWLTFETDGNNKIKVEEIKDDDIKTVWKIVKVFNDVTKTDNDESYKDIEFRFSAYTINDNNELVFNGWLGVDVDQQWNILVDREVFATIYKLEEV